MAKFDTNGTLLNANFISGLAIPESIVFDNAGNIYVGTLGSGIQKFTSAGGFLQTVSTGRTDWIDLAADQSTMLYTTEGTSILKHDVSTDTALGTFASGFGAGEAFTLRILSDGGVLLAFGDDIRRLNPKSTIRNPQSLGFGMDSSSIWRLIAQLQLDLREYDEATQLLTELLRRYPQEGSFYPLLARAQTFQGRFGEAGKTWAKASEFFPERQLINATPADEVRLLMLASLYRQLGQNTMYLATLDRCLELPAQGEALLQKADYFKKQGRGARQAAEYYKQVLVKNPSSFQALSGLADLQYSRGHSREAVQLIQRIRQIDPTDPYFLFSHARYLDAQMKCDQSRRLLMQWLKRNQQQPLLYTLLYHGLVASPDDPILVSRVHMTAATFEDHIRALHDAGFTPVTTSEVDAWYRGTGQLPERPVLITFDDARLDSFQQADPILARYGFKATMFVPLSNVERNLPGYASWQDIRSYHQTGRWDIQSHGGFASDYVPIDNAGRRGLFLVNRQWLADQQRLETPREWERRVAKDYHDAKLAIAKHVGTTPIALAYPESNFGQEGVSGTFPGMGMRKARILNLSSRSKCKLRGHGETAFRSAPCCS